METSQGQSGQWMTGVRFEAVRLQLSENDIEDFTAAVRREYTQAIGYERISISHPLVTVQGNWRSCEG